MSEAYRALEARFARMSHVGGALAMLQWDQQVMMPPGGNGARGEQMATLRQIAHELLTSAETGDLLDEAEQDAAQLGPWQAANLREMRRSQRRATAMPTDLVAALTRAASAAEMTWRDARARADFALLRPALEEVVRLTREEAAAKAAALGRAPYDALLDGYEPGIGTAEIDALFEPLAAFLPEFLERVRRIRSSRCRSRGASPRPGRRRSAGG
jgi:carboxypeptidase Taq